LKITNRSFQCAAPYLWNELATELRDPVTYCLLHVHLLSHMAVHLHHVEHTTPLLRELHWSRVPERIQFRGCVFWHCVHGAAPAYLADSLRLTSDVADRRRLRSVDSPTMLVPSTRRSTLGDQSFPVAAARAWNSLPSQTRAAS